MAVFDFNKLTRRRDEMRLTNKQISSIKGISEATLSRIFKGETKDPSFAVVADICDVLQISMDDVAGIGVSEGNLPAEAPSNMTDALRLMRDHISRIVSHVRSVEHEKDLSNIRQIKFLTSFLYGSVILNIALIIIVVVISLIP